MVIKEIYNTHISPVHEGMTVKEALDLFIKKDLNSVLVIDIHEKLVGILSLQDIAAAIVPSEIRANPSLAEAMYKPYFFHEAAQSIESKSIKEFMRTTFICVSPKTNVMAVAADFFMNDLYIVPVCENDKLVGIVTRSDLRQAFAKAMEIK
jgi:CBS domain-containing protein